MNDADPRTPTETPPKSKSPVWSVRDARNKSLRAPHKAVLFALASRLQGFDDEAYPSLETIADDAGGGLSQTKEWLAELVVWGVVRKRPVTDKRGRHNHYSIDFDRLSETEPFDTDYSTKKKRSPPPWVVGSAGGPADGSAGGPADGSAGGPADGSAGGPADGSAGGPAEKIPSEDPIRRSQGKRQGPGHARGQEHRAEVDSTDAYEDPMARAIIDALVKARVVKRAAALIPAGETRAIRTLAEVILGRMQAKGVPLEPVLHYLGEAVADLTTANPDGAPWDLVSRKIRSYTDKATKADARAGPGVARTSTRQPEAKSGEHDWTKQTEKTY